MIRNKFLRMFFAEPDDMGGGDAPIINVSDAPNEPVDPTPADPTPAEPAAPTAPTFDPKAIAAALGDQLKPFLAKPTEPAKPQMTPEQAKAYLKVWEPDDAFVAKFGNLETQKAALAEMRDKMFEQFSRFHELSLQEKLSPFQQQLSQYQQMEVQRQEQQYNAELEGAYPDLKAPALQPIRAAVVQGLIQSGQKFNSKQELYDAVAKGVEGVIKVQNPNFKLTGGAVAPQPKGASSRSLPGQTPGGGGGGGGSGSGGGATGSKALSILGDPSKR